MITYSLGSEPVSRHVPDQTAEERAKIFAEICERLLELHRLKYGEAGKLVQRLDALSRVSSSAYLMLLHVGCGQLEAVVGSYQDQVGGGGLRRARGCTRQALHMKLLQDMRKLRAFFPQVANVVEGYRESISHHEDAMSSADGLRDAMLSDEPGEAK